MDFLRIPDATWSRIAKHCDVNPSWIKAETADLDCYELSLLTPADRYAAWALRLLAARVGNRFPNDARWLGERIGAPVNVALLCAAGFLEECGRVEAETAETSRKSAANAKRAKRESSPAPAPTHTPARTRESGASGVSEAEPSGEASSAALRQAEARDLLRGIGGKLAMNGSRG